MKTLRELRYVCFLLALVGIIAHQEAENRNTHQPLARVAQLLRK